MSPRAASPLSEFLSGVRVLDLSQYIPGPMATLFLADMGAEVLKIEPPQGDEMQNLGPTDRQGRPTFYRALNAGKNVRRMNLKEAADREAFLDLVAGADVLVEGFRPGVMARLGIDWPVLRGINPRLVMCSISGYGAGNAMAQKAGHDANYLGMMGVLDRNGGAIPQFYDPPLADTAGSTFAALTILGALHGRARTGKGCLIDLALADTLMPLQLIQVADYGETGAVPGRNSTYLNGGAAYYRVYPTRDGRFAVLAAVEPKFWRSFCLAADRPDLLDRQGEPMPQEALASEIAGIFGEMTLDEAEALFGPADCCFSGVRDLGEALNGAHLAERGLVRTAPDGALQALYPAVVDGQPPACRPAMTLHGEPPAPAEDRPAPTGPAANATKDLERQMQKGTKQWP